MKKSLLITEQEKTRILNMHRNAIRKEFLFEENAKYILNNPGDKSYDYKQENGKYYWSKKGQNQWNEATKDPALSAIRNLNWEKSTESPTDVNKAGTSSNLTPETDTRLKTVLDQITDPAQKEYFKSIYYTPAEKISDQTIKASLQGKPYDTSYLDEGWIPKKNESGVLSLGKDGVPNGYKVDVKWYLVRQNQVGQPNQIWVTDNSQQFKVNPNPNNPNQFVGEPMSVKEGETPDKADMSIMDAIHGKPPTPLNYGPEGTTQTTQTTTSGTTANTEGPLRSGQEIRRDFRQDRRDARQERRDARQLERDLRNLQSKYQRLQGKMTEQDKLAYEKEIIRLQTQLDQQS